MSIHTNRSLLVARSKGAQAGHSARRWEYLTAMSKRELAEIVCHLAALCTDSYDETLADDDMLIARIDQEHAALTEQGMI